MSTQSHVVSYFRPLAAASLLAAFSCLAQAAEPMIGADEKPIARKALCEAGGKKVSTDADMKACISYIEARNQKKNWKPEEQMVSIEAVCRERHRGDHLSFYENCRTELGVAYNLLAVKIDGTGRREVSYVKSCGQGIGVAVVGALLLQGGALIADGLGCMGACSAAALKVNSVGLPALAAAGCAGGVATAIIVGGDDSTTQHRRVPTVPPSPK